ncbi:hypothetical protein EON77_00900, partial [bacterium]
GRRTVRPSLRARVGCSSRPCSAPDGPCGHCEMCRTGRPVHCPVWKSSRLSPGGMAERFAVPMANLRDTIRVDDLRPEDAVLIEPLACVVKCLRLAGPIREGGRATVVGLGVMGLLHLFLLKARGVEAIGYDLNPARVAWATAHGLTAALSPESPARESALAVVCPGIQPAADLGFALVEPEGTVAMFAPLARRERLAVPNEAYFLDLKIIHAYSCGPEDTREATERLRAGDLRAEDVVSDLLTDLDALPASYKRMRDGEILKAMVKF